MFDDTLVGLWAAATTFGPALHGALAITHDGARWRASLAGAKAPVVVAGDSLRFAFPARRGEFRGAWTHDGRTITGFWVQPPRMVDLPGDAGGTARDSATPGTADVGAFTQRFASPLVLRRTARDRRGDVWRGTVRPLEDRFTLFLRVSRAPDGALVGAFRNPEQNARGGAAQFRIARAAPPGDSVYFSARPDATRPEVRLGAALVRAPNDGPQELRLVWPDLGRVLTLGRATPAQAAAFYPRPPDAPPYAYRRPPVTGDGWATARARAVGLDEAALTRLVQQIIRTDPAAPRPALIHSLLVARRGKLVLEEYFFGFDRDRPHDLRSAGKTFASVMLGAAMRAGAPVAPDTALYPLLARGRVEPGPFAHPDPRKARITLAHLMTHTSGLACDDNGDASPGNEDAMQAQRAQPDWWRYTLDLPVAHDLGTRYAYCSAGMNLVGAAFTSVTGTWLPAFFERTVARPLQFGAYAWNLMPSGQGYQGGGAYVRPRDLLKLGQTYLHGGVWRGRRLVDAAWVTESTAPRVAVSPATTGLGTAQFRNVYRTSVEGYAWHRYDLRAGERTYAEYEASGNGGQLLIVVPDLDLAVVFTAGNYGQGGIWGRWRDELVAAQILPALRP